MVITSTNIREKKNTSKHNRSQDIKQPIESISNKGFSFSLSFSFSLPLTILLVCYMICECKCDV